MLPIWWTTDVYSDWWWQVAYTLGLEAGWEAAAGRNWMPAWSLLLCRGWGHMYNACGLPRALGVTLLRCGACPACLRAPWDSRAQKK